jgi:hypothetical protein
MRKDIPNFFIVGAPRCGTTALFDYLRSHPQITLSSYKEPHYFATDLVGERFEIFRDHPEKYQALFKHVEDEPCVGEASVGYLFSKCAATNIYSFNPHAKIIIMLRNPIDALYSMYIQAKYTGTTRFDSFEELMAVHDEVPPEVPVETARRLLSLEGVRFASQVKRYLDVFDRSAVHIILYDDFSRNTAGEYRKTLRFLDVDEAFVPSEFAVINASQESRNPVLKRILQSNLLLSIGRTMPDITLPFYRALKILNSKQAGQKNIPQTLRQRMLAELYEDIQELSRLIDRDLSHWMTSNA